MVLVIMGPMGCGKTTIGQLLAHQLGWSFIDGDDYHPETNVNKMRQGRALTDKDRLPWLLRIRSVIDAWQARGENGIVACSALKKIYREWLGIDQKQVISIFLHGSSNLLLRRISSRQHRYMPDSLLQSQLDTLEPPADGIQVDIADTPETIVAMIIKDLPDY
jgi:carbohydrate kinase (thermoresistant glucokinase family)